MFKKEGLLLLLVLFSNALIGQQQREGNLLAWVDSIIDAIPSTPGTNEYIKPNTTQNANIDSAISRLLHQEYNQADSFAVRTGYHILRFRDTTNGGQIIYDILMMNPDSVHYWGTYIFNPTALRQNLLIQCPHPIFDSKTGEEGVYIFKNAGARGYYLSGAHRCSNTDSTDCKGTTTVCGYTKFRVSDPAHNTSHIFQTATKVFNTKINNAIVFQMHGFARQGGDPNIILGNGTTESPSGIDYALEFSQHLHYIDTNISFKIAHVDTTWTRLTGTVNVQGRYINGVSNPCTGNNVTTPNGRFVHIEQDSSLRNSLNGWNKVSSAIENAVPLNPLSLKWISVSSHVETVKYNMFIHQPTDLYIQYQPQKNAMWEPKEWVTTFWNSGIISGSIPHPVRFYALKLIASENGIECHSPIVLHQNNTNTQLIAFPNPMSQQLTITGITESSDIYIYNQLGTCIFYTHVEPTENVDFNISTDTWGSGIYFIKVHGISGRPISIPIIKPFIPADL